MNRLINVAHVRAYALDVSARYRNGKFTRVSEEFLNKLDADVRAMIASRVRSHPSMGVTLK